MARRPLQPQTVEVVEEHYYGQPITKEPIDQIRYGGKYVAIWRRRVIDADADFEKLWKRMARRGLAQKVFYDSIPRLGTVYV